VVVGAMRLSKTTYLILLPLAARDRPYMRSTNNDHGNPGLITTHFLEA